MFLADGPTLSDDSVDVDIMLSKLNSCCNDRNFDISAFFAIHGVEPDDVPLTHEDVILHFLNGQFASRNAPGCSEVARGVRSPIKMALAITEAIMVLCERKQIPSDNFRVYCSAIGVTTTRRPEYTILTQKLTARCNALRPPLNCNGLETIFCLQAGTASSYPKEDACVS